AIASTGAEPELIDLTTSAAAFTPFATVTTIAAGGAPRPVARVAPAPVSPVGRAFSAPDLDAAGTRRLAAMLGGGLTLVDYDGDGDLDLFVASAAGQVLLRNDDEGRGWTDVTAMAAVVAPSDDSVPIGAVAGDYDNDGAPDLFVLAYGGNRLYHNDGNGRFRDVTAAAHLPPYPFLPGAAAFVDIDHAGDLDIVIAGLADVATPRARAGGRTMLFPRDFAPAP